MYVRNYISNQTKFVEGFYDDVIDQVVCVSTPYQNDDAVDPEREGAKCGFLEQKGVTVTYEDDGGIELDQQRIAAIPVRDGDSGGPVFKNPRTAVGIVSGSRGVDNSSRKVIYSHIGYVPYYLNATVVTSPTPNQGG